MNAHVTQLEKGKFGIFLDFLNGSGDLLSFKLGR